MKEVVLLVIVLFPLSIAAEAKLVDGFSIDLIHRDSPLSPFHNSSMTQTEVLTNAAMRSISRINSFFHYTTADNGNKAETVVIPNGGDYLMKIFIGTPPVESLAIADTGSDLIWIQCLPCQQCYPQNAPIFDPQKSTTYETISCDSNTCNLLPLRSCGPSGQCRYQDEYEDKSFTAGDLAADTISFGSNGGRSLAFPKTILGCGHDNIGRFKSTGTGIVGLGGGPLSLVSQLGDEIGGKFSYCLLPPYSTNSASKLKFGSESTVSGKGVVSTPLVSKSQLSFYYLTLEGVSIGGKLVRPEQSAGNIIIDCGTTLTMLESSLYNSVEAAIVEAIGDDVIPERYPAKPFKLCYRDGTIKDLPNITFQFFGADYGLQLHDFNTFGRLNHMLCFLMLPTDGTSMFGNLQQVFFNVEYDLQEKTISFAPSDCKSE